MMVLNNIACIPMTRINGLPYPIKVRMGYNYNREPEWLFPDIPQGRIESTYTIRGVCSYCFNIASIDGTLSDGGIGPAFSVNGDGQGTIASVTKGIIWNGRYDDSLNLNYFMPSLPTKTKVASHDWYGSYDGDIHVRSVSLTGFDSLPHKYPSSWTTENTPKFFTLEGELAASSSKIFRPPLAWAIIDVTNINIHTFGYLASFCQYDSTDKVIRTATTNTRTYGIELHNGRNQSADRYTTGWNPCELVNSATLVYKYPRGSSTPVIRMGYPLDGTATFAAIRQIDTRRFLLMTYPSATSINVSLQAPKIYISRPILSWSMINPNLPASLSILSFGQDFYKVVDN